MFEQWCSSCNGNGDVTSVQENNPEPVTPANVVFGNDAD
jgi:hypothetical protein